MTGHPPLTRRAAITEVCASLRPGEPLPSVVATGVVLARGSEHRSEDPVGWPARAVARIWALINVGECGEASAVAQRLRSDLDDGLGPNLSRIARQAVSLVCAEAFLRDGRPGDALPHARTAARRAWQAGA